MIQREDDLAGKIIFLKDYCKELEEENKCLLEAGQEMPMSFEEFGKV